MILAVGSRGGLSPAELASWIFGVFFLNGLLTVLSCWLYRQPLAFFWTIPGTVLVGPALTHLSWPEVVGAFFATGVLMLVLGLSGWVRRAMAAVPMPIVMGMVAGVFLRFGTDLVHALRDDLVDRRRRWCWSSCCCRCRPRALAAADHRGAAGRRGGRSR